MYWDICSSLFAPHLPQTNFLRDIRFSTVWLQGFAINRSTSNLSDHAFWNCCVCRLLSSVFFSCQEKSNLADEWSRSFPEHWDHVGSAFSQATTRFLPFSAPDGLPDYHPDSLWSSRQIEWPLSLVPSRFHLWRLPVRPFCCLHPTGSLARHDTVAGPFVPAVMFGDYSLVYVSPFAFRSLRCN